MMPPQLLPDLYVSYDVCEVGEEWDQGIQSLCVCFGDLINYFLGMVFPFYPPLASCSQPLLSALQG